MILPTGLLPHQLRFCNSDESPEADDEWISINELERNEHASTIGTVLIAQIHYYKLANVSPASNVFGRNKKAANFSFNRMIALSCLTSSPGNNMFFVLLGKQRLVLLLFTPFRI